MITIILFFIFVLTLILYYFLSYYGKSGMIKLIPGPRSFPIIGNIPKILSFPSKKKNTLSFFKFYLILILIILLDFLFDK